MPGKIKAKSTACMLPDLTPSYIEAVFLPRYRDVGFDIRKVDLLPVDEIESIETSWARKLQHNKQRQVFHLIAVAK